MYYIFITIIIILIIAISMSINIFYPPTIESFDPDHMFDRPIQIQNFNGIDSLPINNYVIKSSYNSAHDSRGYVSKDSIKYNLSRGCRLLDFEIVYDPSSEAAAFIGKAAGNRNDALDSKNKLLLDDACDTIASYAFSHPIPNPNDPLFIHLRIKPLIDENDEANTDLFDNISSTIEFKFRSLLFSGDVDVNSTPLSQFKNKIVMIIENNDNYDLTDTFEFSFLESKVNGTTITVRPYDEYVSASKSLFSFFSTDSQKDDASKPEIVFDSMGKIIQPNDFRVAVPEYSFASDFVNEPSCYPMITDYAVQSCCFRFYRKSSHLEEYENLFDHFKSSFIPLENARAYIQRLMRDA